MDEDIEAALMEAGQRINALATNERRLIDELFKAHQQRDELRRALEIIAVGDAENPQAQAAEELIALGWWRDIPDARAIAATPGNDPLKQLGARLAVLLDEDQWAECEALLMQAGVRPNARANLTDTAR